MPMVASLPVLQTGCFVRTRRPLTGDFIGIQYVNRRDDENGLRDETGCAGGYTAAGDCIREKTAAQLTREHREESAFALAY
jgi:hypothetical protein